MMLIGLGIFLIILIILAGLAFLALGIFLLVFWIMMIIDCAKRKFKSDTDKVVWILILLLLGLLGGIIYYFVVKRN